jgi:Tol biopolymer transport system component
MPPALDRLVKRCLEADPDERWQSARDIEWELKAVLTVPAAGASVRPSDYWPYLAALSLLGLVLAWVAVVHFREVAPQPATVRLSISLPEKSRVRALAVSPNGSQIAMVLFRDGKQQLWIRALDAFDVTPLAGTEDAASPFWSPDSRYIGFFADAKLKKVERSGGPVQTLCDAQGGKGGTWNRAGDILFSTDGLGQVQRVSAGGGTPAEVPHKPNITRLFPFFLTDGEHYLVLQGREAGSANSGIWLASIASSESRQILPDASPPEFVEPINGSRFGHVLFTRNETLSALPFDPRRLEAAGESVPIAQQETSRDPVAVPLFSASAKQGVLAYVTAARAEAQYVWRDRHGRYLGAAGPAANVVSLSPDGTRLVGDGKGTHILDLASGVSTDLLTGRGNRNPIWSPDGKYIAVNYGKLGWGVYRKPSSGAGDWEPLTLTDRLTAPLSWSPDGRFLMYAQLNPETAADLLALPMDGERKPFAVVQTPANENQGQFSPDGHWVAYTSNESSLSEIYVIPFPPFPGGGRWRVSKGGGVMPRWRRDGKELFYISPDSQMMAVDVAAVDVATRQVFKSGNPHPLFQTDIVDTGIRTGPMSWDIAPDGRFLIISETSTDASITVVLNWRAAEPN